MSTTVNTYTRLEEEDFIECIQALDLLYTDFLNQQKSGFVIDNKIDFDELHNCISRVHQREHYYNVFHDMPTGASEVKKIALYCYWILKYKPFRTVLQTYGAHIADIGIDAGTDDNKKKWEWCSQYLNERFCLYLLTNALHKMPKGCKVKKLPLSDQAIDGLLYSMKHHDISKEALTEMFEMIEDMADYGGNQAWLQYKETSTHKD